MVKVWKAKHTSVQIIDAASLTITTTETLDTAFSNASAEDIVCHAKNITVTEPEGDVDKIDLLGTSGNFQCAEKDEKPFGLASISGTLVFHEDENIEVHAFGSGTSVSGGYKRYQPADITNRQDVAMLVRVEDSALTKEVMFALDNAKMTRVGDIRISGPDGHWEQDFMVKCLPRDFYWEVRD